MKLKLHTKSKTLYAFLMALFSVLGWGQGFENFETGLSTSGYIDNGATRSLSTGNWSSNRSLLRSTTKYAGSYSCQIQKNASAYISTPSLNSCGTVTFWYNAAPIVKKTVGGVTTNLTAIAGNTSGIFTQYTVNVNDSSTGIVISIYNANDATGYIDDFNWSAYTNSTAAPTVTASSFTGTVGTSFSNQIIATESPTSYALESGSSLPAGLSINNVTGEVSGTPTEAGSFSANVTATNSIGTSVPATLSFTIGKGDQIISGFTNQSLFLSSPAFTLPANTNNANLPVSYTSSNTSVATVSGNSVTIAGVGTTTITAVQGGDNNWNPLNTQITLTVSPDPITYNGIGRFEKINSISELTDGYYVVAYNDTQAMDNNYSGSILGNTSIAVSSNVIINPATSIVWKIKQEGSSRSIFNEAIAKYLSYTGSSNNIQIVDNVTTDNQLWNITYSSVQSEFLFTNTAVQTRRLQYNTSSPRFACYTGSQQDLTLYKLVETTTWDGNSWSNGLPDTKDVILTGVYSTTSQPVFTTKNITIKNGGVLEINGTNTINAEDVIVEDGGNLVIKDSGALNHSGTFKVLKNGTSVQDKYAFWSSPVASQNLTAMYSGSTPSFITEYDTATDYFVNVVSTTSVFAKGYSIKTPVVSNVEFIGIPNNGTQTFPLSTAGNGYNLVGNPYPSNLDLTAFYNTNSGRISNTFYFWDNTSNSVTVQGGATTTNIGYATYNPVSQIWTPAPNISAIPAENSVKIGQGFIVKATNAADTSLSFSNDMRTAAAATFYNKNNSSTEGKFWLRLNSSYNTNNTFAVAYINGASNSFDPYDSKAIGTGSDAFYTLAGTQKLVIQGRESFNINDVVPVGAKHFQNGNFTISLVQKEGIFNNGQAIYLHDKVTGTYTDLQNNTYSFAANSGDVSSRFEIVYKLGVLSTSEVSKDAFEVYRNGENFFVRNNKNIDSVTVYDASGRQIQAIEGGSKEIRITLNAKGVYVVKAVSEGKEYTKKIIK